MFDLTALDDFKLVVMAGEGKAVLARFQNGRLTKTDAVAVRREVTLQGGKTKFLYDMAGDSGLNYIGEPCEGASEEWSVVIRDKATGEIQMLEAEAVLFRPNTSAFTSPQKLDMATPVDQSWFEKKADLAMSFGSKKQQSAIRARKRNAATSIAGGQLFPDVSGSEAEEDGADELTPTKVKKEDVANMEQSVDAIMPNVNYEAKSPSEVYNLDEVLSPERISLMAEDVKEFVGKSVIQLKEEGYPQICILLSQKVPRDPTAQLKFGAYVLYLNSLIRLLRSDSKFNSITLQGFMEFKLTPSVVKWLWDSSFVARTGKFSKVRSLPKKNRDRIYLLSDLKVEEKKLLTYMRMLGCSLAKERGVDGGKTVVLKGPPAKPSLLTPKKFGRR